MSGGADKVQALVVGAGPAGLMAADVLSKEGVEVLLADAMPSPARKFLMAGKSGLNLTRVEPIGDFLARYSDAPQDFADMVSAFGPKDVMAWSEAMGQQVFTGSTGRVFPTAMKASPLLRAWLARLDLQGVTLRRRWRWTGWNGASARFDTPDGPKVVNAEITILALGGASWRRLGSDGNWSDSLRAEGIDVLPFKPSNVGLAINWSAHMSPHFGAPVKGTALSAGSVVSRGEFVVTASGLEGGGVYDVSRAVRDGAVLRLDLCPDLSEAEVLARLSRMRGKASIANHLRKTLRLGAVQRALLMEWGRPLPVGAADLARLVKALPVRHSGPGDMDGAISTGGGVAWSNLDGLELAARRGVFVAGEMLDWDAPTGGYLITGCLATGRAAALQALERLKC